MENIPGAIDLPDHMFELTAIVRGCCFFPYPVNNYSAAVPRSSVSVIPSNFIDGHSGACYRMPAGKQFCNLLPGRAASWRPVVRVQVWFLNIPAQN